MLTELQIENFRSIRSLRLDGLGRVNILGGRNGSGKSTVLEAVELLVTPKPLVAAFQNARRGLEVLPSQNTAQGSVVEEPWLALFNDFIPGKGVGLAGEWNGRAVTATYETAFPVEQMNHIDFLARNPAYVFSLQQWIGEGRILRIRAAQSAGGAQQESLVHPVPDGTWGWTAEISDVAPCVAVWATDNASQIQQKDQHARRMRNVADVEDLPRRAQQDAVRHLTGRRGLPLKEAVGQHQAAPPPQQLPKRRLLGQRLGPGVDGFGAGGRILAPTRHQPPAQQLNLARRGVGDDGGVYRLESGASRVGERPEGVSVEWVRGGDGGSEASADGITEGGSGAGGA